MAIRNKKQSGVTLIELIVVVAIFSLVSSILIFNYSDFSTNVSIRTLSQEVALTARKVQTYATSVRGIDNTLINTRSFPAYGISFSLDATGGVFEPNQKQFIIFADIPESTGELPNKRYSNGSGSCGNPIAGDECLEKFSINTSDSIVAICPNGVCVGSGAVDITFRRPIPDAIICYKLSFGDTCQTSNISYVDIIVQSAKGLTRKVSIWNTGQISVK